MIGTILALLCGALLLIPLPPLAPYFAYSTGHAGLGFLLHSYQLLTYTLLHANLEHYTYNMLWLVPSCWYLERQLGRKPLLLLCGVSAATSALLWQFCYLLSAQHMMAAMLGLPDPQGLIGASGMASATVAAALLVLGELEPDYAFVSYLMLACIFLCQLADACLAQLGGANIAYWGHIGGMLTALFFAPTLCRLARRSQ